MRELVHPDAAGRPLPAQPPRSIDSLFDVQRLARNRAVALVLQRQIRGMRNPSQLTEDEAFRERGRVLDELSRLGPDAAEREELLRYAQALERRADSSRHSGGAAGALNATHDAQVRLRDYVAESRRMSQQILDDLEAGRIGHEEARNLAVQQRNRFLASTRDRLTPGGRAMSEAIKEEGRGLESLLTRYSERIVRTDPARFGLSTAQVADSAAVSSAAQSIRNSPEVSRAIVGAAGRSDRTMTLVARGSRVLGPLAVGASVVSSGYEVLDAEPGYDRARVITREAGGFAGGWLAATGGSLAAAWAASLVCGPGAAVCAIALSLVIVGGSGYAGGRVGEWAAEDAFTAVTQAPVPAATLWGAGGGYGGLMRRDFERSIGPHLPGVQRPGVPGRREPATSGGERP
ncbi:MAG: hypothetical protein ACR2MO_13980 [Acidimicrobiales bacterium]